MADKEKPLEWIASSYKDLMALPPDVRRRFGYALSLAQMGDQDDAAKVLKGFGGKLRRAGGRRRRCWRYLSSGLHGEVCGSSVRPALLPEEEQERNRHAKGRHGHHLRSAEGGRSTGTGATKCKNESLKASRFNAPRATSSPTLGCPTPRN